jgi:uncharacterized protein YkwD
MTWRGAGGSITTASSSIADRAARAENVAYGCGDEACTIRQWSRSAGHRRNMLRRDVHGYGMVSSNGRRYWALELGH